MHVDGLVHALAAAPATCFRSTARAFFTALVMVLAACGGGSSGPLSPPTITSQPADATVTTGQAASFTVRASGGAPLRYQWRRNGVDIGGATGASYTTPATTAADSGAQFSVVVSNLVDRVTSAAATLTVTPVGAAPVITTQPVSVSVTAPASASFSVVATGTAPLAYQWLRNGAPIAGATNASYATPATALGDSGTRFAVQVSNASGATSSAEAVLTVTDTVLPPSIVNDPASITVNAGQAATFTVDAGGSAPFGYQWYRDGVAITGATGATYTTAPAVDADSGAVFSVQVTNASGTTAQSGEAVLTVTPLIQPPVIVTQPADTSVIVGQAASFAVVASGAAPLTYQWRRNGANIAGANAAGYTTPASTLADSGAVFSVVVSNASAASASSNGATLTVTAALVAPGITTQPANASIGIGDSATFSVLAAGTAPLAYQWQRNGVDIPGATAASYTTAPAVIGDNGSLFRVVVSNAHPASATSAAATLTVVSQWTGIREDGAVGLVRDAALAVATDPSGNVVIGGHTEGVFNAPENRVGIDPFIAKYSAGGSLLWVRQVFDHGALSGEYAIRGVATDSAGNIYGVGDTVGALPGNTSAGGRDIIVVKYDPAGNPLWQRQFGSDANNDSGNAIAVDASGSAFVVGNSGGQLPGQAPNQGLDFYIAKLDTNGNLLWIRQSGTSSGTSDSANGVTLDAAGNAYMTGRVGHNYGSSPRRNLNTDAYVAKYDTSGNQVWFSRVAGEHHDEGFAIAAAADGNSIYLTGQTNSNFDLPGYPSLDFLCCGHDDAFVVRLDGNGAIQWATNLSSVTQPGPTYFRDETRGITTNATGSAVFVTGFTLGVMPGDTSRGAQDIFVARYEPTGTRVWVKQFGGTQAVGSTHPDSGHGIALDGNGDVFVAGEVLGTFGTPNPNPNTVHSDWFVMKLRPNDGTPY
ncbi:SBBP repeat-containing protein [Variovorax sp. J22R133]|uniref:SBBP repeat-containing protein n=1 Tax=Variovorax brevis TaxID=3053503 RepID=UPI0025755A4D|nr:SBBP repeat-containing protein [Variovorax sp. J22R133]MDM0115177.1 SBBP repeat-containing protein [Variovorax sp. J22R133]